MHYFMAKLGQQGITFELLKLARVRLERGMIAKLSVADRIPLDLVKMRSRRSERLKSIKGVTNTMEGLVNVSK